MNTSLIVIVTVLATLMLLTFFPGILGWFIYGIMMIGRVVVGIFGVITGKR